MSVIYLLMAVCFIALGSTTIPETEGSTPAGRIAGATFCVGVAAVFAGLGFGMLP